MSETSRLILVTLIVRRVLSILKSRRSGCVYANCQFALYCGLKRTLLLSLSARLLFNVAASVPPPHPTCCVTPALYTVRSCVTPRPLPDSCSWLLGVPTELDWLTAVVSEG